MERNSMTLMYLYIFFPFNHCQITVPMSDWIPKSKTTVKKAVPFVQKERSQFPIVGIGVSAGGLEALELLYKNMPKDNGQNCVYMVPPNKRDTTFNH